MPGLYENAGMSPGATNNHWKREQDNYLTQIGAMHLIQNDPMARLGYVVRSDPEMKTLNMGSNPAHVGKENWGLYQFYPGNAPDFGLKTDGSMDVSVGLKPRDYAETVAHELGHVGSRNSKSDEEYAVDARSNQEEKRQRITDYLNNPEGSQARKDALWYLSTQMGMSDDQIRKELKAAARTRQQGSKTAQTPKPKPKPTKAAKKKKTLVDFLEGTGWTLEE